MRHSRFHVLVLAALIGGALARTAESAAPSRMPYLQSPGKDRITICWRTAVPVIQTLAYGRGSAIEGTVSDPAPTKNHELTLVGLQPGAKYTYLILEAGNVVLANPDKFYFTTDTGLDKNSFCFFFTGDIGAELPDGLQAVTGAMIRNVSPRADFGLLCGDTVYPDGASTVYDAQLMSLWKDILCNTPVWPALGNHDWYVDPDNNFCKEWALPNNEHYYSFDYGTAHFICLDTADGFLYDEANQLAWLRQDLRTNYGRHQWSIVFYHFPILTCTYKANLPQLQVLLWPIFDEFKVDLVLNGHAHTYERLFPMRNGQPVDQQMNPNYRDPHGTIYVVSGCGGKMHANEPTTFCGPTAAFKDEALLFTQAFVMDKVLYMITFDSFTGGVVDVMRLEKTKEITDVTAVPAARGLGQNVPNPFNPTTSIPFELANPSRVLLRVYRVDGVLVRSLEDRMYPAGAHLARWDGRDARGARVPSGVYLCRMDAENMEWSIKMMMVK